MSSIIDVCNKALDKLGQNPIISLTDGNKAANLCSRNWPLVRDQVLREHPWNFAMKRDILAPSTDAPAWGFENQFPLPADWLRLVEIRDLSTGEYQVESNTILANSDALYVRYIFRQEDPNKYDALFVDAVASCLAVELAEPLTQSTQKKQLAMQMYVESLVAAKRIDGQENPPVEYEEDDWIKVRY